MSLNKELKLCDITMFYPLSHPSGVKTYIESKRKYILEQKHIQHVLIVPGEKDDSTLKENLIQYIVSSPQLFWNKSYRLLCSYKKIKDILVHENPDIIELGDVYLMPWLVKRIVKRYKLKAKIVGFYHADFLQRDVYRLLSFFKPLANGARFLTQKYAAFAYNKLDACLVSSRSIKTKLESWGIKAIYTTPFGIHTDLFEHNETRQPRDKEDAMSDEKIKALYCGRIAAEKGIVEFIPVAHKINQDKMRLDLSIIGTGNLEKQAVFLANGASYIHFLSFIGDKKKLIEQYRKFDVLIVPCADETFGLSALEALACGTPVAALNGLGGVEEFVNEKTGFLLGRDIDAYVSFFKTIRKQDLQNMRSFIKKDTLEKYDINKRFDHQFKIYNKLVQRT